MNEFEYSTNYGGVHQVDLVFFFWFIHSQIKLFVI